MNKKNTRIAATNKNQVTCGCYPKWPVVLWLVIQTGGRRTFCCKGSPPRKLSPSSCLSPHWDEASVIVRAGTRAPSLGVAQHSVLCKPPNNTSLTPNFNIKKRRFCCQHHVAQLKMARRVYCCSSNSKAGVCVAEVTRGDCHTAVCRRGNAGVSHIKPQGGGEWKKMKITPNTLFFCYQKNPETHLHCHGSL